MIGLIARRPPASKERVSKTTVMPRPASTAAMRLVAESTSSEITVGNCVALNGSSLVIHMNSTSDATVKVFLPPPCLTSKSDALYLKGDEISFSVTREVNNNKFTSKYNGKISGDSIKGKIGTERNGQALSRDWEAKRVPQQLSDEERALWEKISRVSRFNPRSQ